MSPAPGTDKSQSKPDKEMVLMPKYSEGKETKKEPQDDEDKRECEELSSIEKELDAEIEKMKAELEAGPSMKDTMERLHEYNEIKDAAQVVLGAMASMHGVTIASLHQEYNLPMAED